MIKKLRLLIFVFLLPACVPVNQQMTAQPDGKELAVLNDEELYAQVRYVIENGINEHHTQDVKWEGPCQENPIFKDRFQSGYSVAGGSPFKISDQMLMLTISYGGGCGCSQKLMVWNGKFVTDAEGRKIIELVFSFKNNDSCRAIINDRLVYDLKTLNLMKGEKVYIQINKLPSLEAYLPA